MPTPDSDPRASWTKTDREIENYNRLAAHLARGEAVWGARPFHLEFALHERCNLRCPSCPQSLGPEHVDGVDPRDLDRARAGKILDAILPVASLLTPSAGSEPLLGDFEFLVAKCREHGTLLNLITNGTLLSEERLALCVDQLSRLQISIDSHRPEVFAELRRPAKLERVAANARLAARQCAQRNIPFWFTLVLSQKNQGELADYVAWAAEMGASRVHVLELLPLTPAYEALRVPFDEELREKLAAAVEVARARAIDLSFELPGDLQALHLFGAPRLRLVGGDVLRLFHDHLFLEHPRFCSQAASYLRVDPAGNVYPCCRSGKALWMGNLLQQSFEEIWNGASFRALREELFADRPNPTCAPCPVRTSYARGGAR
ncbi:MAG: radical SAM protein [Planctomycetes bacterium]|nr:radical SAM protein [Planctomycetota bacterium]